jgi:hypothetical protein
MNKIRTIYLLLLFALSALPGMQANAMDTGRDILSQGIRETKPAPRSYTTTSSFIRTRVISTDHTSFKSSVFFDYEHGYVFRLFKPFQKAQKVKAKKFKYFKRSICNKRIQLRKLGNVCLVPSDHLFFLQLLHTFPRWLSSYDPIIRSVLVHLFSMANAAMRN